MYPIGTTVSELAVLLVTVSAIDGLSICRLERDFAVLAAVRARRLMHLARTEVSPEAALVSECHLLFPRLFSYTLDQNEIAVYCDPYKTALFINVMEDCP
jgi:hypothetical protein